MSQPTPRRVRLNRPAPEAIIALHHSGKGGPQIAAELDCPDRWVRAALKAARIARDANRTRASINGDSLADPKRADRLLRRFSWESPE